MYMIENFELTVMDG